MTPEEQKQFRDAVKEAIEQWMDKKFSEFGRWSFYGIVAAALGVLGFLIFAKGLK
jgi:hypothetical protein